MPTTLRGLNGQYRGKPQIENYIEADSQTYTAGMIVVQSSNKVAIAVADGSDLDSTGAAILGIVCRDGRNTTSNTAYDVPVMVVHDQFYLRLPFWASTAGTSEYEDFEPGDTCVLRNVGGIFVANIGTTSNPTLRLVAKEPGIDGDETYWHGLFKVIAAERAMG